MAVNAVAPFVLCSRLQPLLAPSVLPGALLRYVALRRKDIRDFFLSLTSSYRYLLIYLPLYLCICDVM